MIFNILLLPLGLFGIYHTSRFYTTDSRFLPFSFKCVLLITFSHVIHMLVKSILLFPSFKDTLTTKHAIL